MVFGLPPSWGMLAVPFIGFLTGLGFAFMGQWISGIVPSIDSFTYVTRALITPLFLLSGTFFPITGLPQWAQTLAQLNPLYHCVELVRDAVFGWEPVADLGPPALPHRLRGRSCGLLAVRTPAQAADRLSRPAAPRRTVVGWGHARVRVHRPAAHSAPTRRRTGCSPPRACRTVEAGGRTFLQVEPEALRLLTDDGDARHRALLRPAHLAQLRAHPRRPRGRPNDRFVALDLLKNANIAAGGVLPMCQDTGTAIVMGKRGQQVLTARRRRGGDQPAASTTPTPRLNLRYSQMAPLTMWEEKNTGSNLPAQIELYADTAPGHETTYKFLFMAKGGGSANKSLPVPGDQGGPQPRRR